MVGKALEEREDCVTVTSRAEMRRQRQGTDSRQGIEMVLEKLATKASPVPQRGLLVQANSNSHQEHDKAFLIQHSIKCGSY